MGLNLNTINDLSYPTLILSTRIGKRIGILKAKNVIFKNSLNEANEISFKLYKYENGKIDELWDEVDDFKLVWCKDHNIWFQISVDIDESDETIKTVSGMQLAHAELSQIMLYDIEINTEDDIAREDYIAPTVFYSYLHPETSLLKRIMEKAPHYSIMHVDPSLQKIQRSFSFNNISIYDAFQEIAEEIGCIFIFEPKKYNIDSARGGIWRWVYVYDLWSNCNDCGYRGEYTGVCSKCGSTNITEGYGEDTNIFVTAEELSKEISMSGDTDSVKNCFKLEAGDDLMTATIKNCNPNGSDYIWCITDYMKKDMPDELVEKIDSYDDLYNYYDKEYVSTIDSELTDAYNALVEKYSAYDSRFSAISPSIQGFANLMGIYYNVIDLDWYLTSEMMQNVGLDDTTAEAQIALLTVDNIKEIAVANCETVSVSTANSAALGVARAIIDNRYKVEIVESSLTSDAPLSWTGKFKVTNYSDETDTITGDAITLPVVDEYKSFVEQKIEKVFSKYQVDNVSISGIFSMEYDSFCSEMQKYCLNRLTSFHDACQACIDVLIEQGIGTKATWAGKDPNLYDDLYVPYYNKLIAIESEIAVREREIAVISGTYDSNGDIIAYGIKNCIEDIKSEIQDKLNFQNYLGTGLWKEFVEYRREDKYSNENYISDGLSNSELIENALDFIEVAKNEIYKAAEIQYTIRTTLNNLFSLPEFASFDDSLEVGSWIRVGIDEKVYKIRLLSYEINYDDVRNINVELSNVLKIKNGISDQQSIISQAVSMATSYNSTKKQAENGNKTYETFDKWNDSGFDASTIKIVGGTSNQSQVWDNHGILLRAYDSITDSYDDCQMKIVNSTIAITDDNWETVKTAVGAYYYTDPDTGELKFAYGVNAETIVGNLIIGNQLSITNENNTLRFGEDGLEIIGENNSFTVNPNSQDLLVITRGDEKVFYVDSNGLLHINGDGANLNIENNLQIETINGRISLLGESSHTHDNKDVLDNITNDDYINWQSTKNKAHTHDNKDALDNITSTDVLSWNFAYLQTHEHENKDVLDSITAIDTSLSSTSTNPVQNKAVKEEFEKYLPLSGGQLTGTLIGTTFIGGLSGNAGSATRLQYKRTINGVEFDGTRDITLPCDETPTKNSTNPVTSNGIYTAIARSRANITAASVDVSITPDMWQDGTVTITSSEIHADSVVTVRLQMGTATAELVQAVGNALIMAKSQAEGSITLECLGEIPAVTIPITLTILTDTSYAVIQTIDFTVLPSDWVDGVATLTDANFFADSIVDIGLQVGAATADIANAAANAVLAAQSQTDGAITLVCLGTVPAVALPLAVTVINVGG